MAISYFWLAQVYRDDSGKVVTAPRDHDEYMKFKGEVHVSFRGCHLEWTFDLPQDLLGYERFMQGLKKAHEHGRDQKASQIRDALNI